MFHNQVTEGLLPFGHSWYLGKSALDIRHWDLIWYLHFLTRKKKNLQIKLCSRNSVNTMAAAHTRCPLFSWKLSCVQFLAIYASSTNNTLEGWNKILFTLHTERQTSLKTSYSTHFLVAVVEENLWPFVILLPSYHIQCHTLWGGGGGFRERHMLTDFPRKF